MKTLTVRFLVVTALWAMMLAVDAQTAFAAEEPTGTDQLETVLDNIRTWIVGIAGTLIVVMLSIAGVRYLMASDPGETEKAKSALRAAAIGFAVILLAPILVAVLKGILVGSGQ